MKFEAEFINKIIDKYKIALFMVIRNSKVLPKGLELGKSQEEINKMSYETMLEVLGMLDLDKAKEMFEEGKKSYEQSR